MRIRFNYTATSIRKIKDSKKPIFNDIEKDVIYTFSGKSSLALLLRYYRQSGKLKNKSEQVLVSPWMGYWIYMTMDKFCFPTTVFNENVRGILLYHQWGFPQKTDEILSFCKEKKLFCIEDCAHAFQSFYQGKRLGTFGDASLFSLAKFFPSVVGGAIWTKSDKMKTFIKKTLSEHESDLARKAFAHRIKLDSYPTKKNYIELERYYVIYDKLLKCPDYSLAAVRQQLINGALEIRRKNFNLFKEAFAGYDHMETLFKENVLPWAIPLFFRKKVCEKIATALARENIESGVYHFDINRNMLKPNFIECVAVPCHQGMATEDVMKAIEIIRKSA
jgi:dTDP-4-amino-4,6-dideoxygalactose transaminase